MNTNQFCTKSYTAEIAIIEKNTLTALGLETILEEFIPNAMIRIFPTFMDFMSDTPDMYAHYFVSSQIYFEHVAYFAERSPKAIILSNGESNLFNGVSFLDVSLSRDKLIKGLMNLKAYGHTKMPHPDSCLIKKESNKLTPREIDVLHLIAKGLLNKQIAEKLHIGLTTVISHRKSITDKLGIKSPTGLAIYAVLHGYIEPDSI